MFRTYSNKLLAIILIFPVFHTWADDVQLIKNLQKSHDRAVATGNYALQFSFYDNAAQQWMKETLQKAASYPKEKLLELPCHDSLIILHLRNEYNEEELKTLSATAPLWSMQTPKSDNEIDQLNITTLGNSGFINTHNKAHLMYTRENGSWKITLQESQAIMDMTCALAQKIQSINNTQLLLLTLEKQGIPFERGLKLLRGPL